MKKNIKWIICFISLIIFLILGYFVRTNSELGFDSYVYKYISCIINDNFTHIVKFITFLGSATIVILITLICFIFIKNKKIGLYMILNLIFITIFQYLLKFIFARPRPIGINLIEETNYSFPSGHSLTAMAFYGFIIYLIYKANLKYKKIFILLLGLLILLIGLSRVYLGVHFITDILGGFTFSLSYLIIYTNIIKNKIAL